ncbi:MAG TPA: GatB/YqeY domain-containing protein [Candidatus Saccharimonadales bacterium]|nr:GatB/YqeY domain-containing protein [Candidatus Saccharimonadales bacterium]
MALKSAIDNDLKAALLGGDRFVTEVLRGLKAAILNEEVAQGKRDEGLSDGAIEQIIAKEIKKRNESASLYDQGGRPELADNERKESEAIKKYLPTQLTEDEIKVIIDKIIAELNIDSPSAMGQVIGAVKKEVGSSADGATVAKLVKQALN